MDSSPDSVWVYTDAVVPPKLTEPADGSSTGRMTEVNMVWGRVDNVSSYYLQWDIDSGFASAKSAEVGTTTTLYGSVKSSSTSFVIVGLQSGRTYYWRVSAVEGRDAFSNWSEVWSFTTGLPGAEWNPFLTAEFVPGNVTTTRRYRSVTEAQLPMECR
jgi:hypothetical protein